MQKKKTLLISIFTIVFFTLVSCKKESVSSADTYGCWTCTDALLNPLITKCAANEAAAYDSTKTLNGGMTMDDFHRWCHKK